VDTTEWELRGIMCNPPLTSHPKAWLPFPSAHEAGERRDAYAKTRAVRVRQETSCLCYARVEWAKWHIATAKPFHATERAFTTHSTRNKHHVSATITPSQHGTLASLFRARQMAGNGQLRRVVAPAWPRKSGPRGCPFTALRHCFNSSRAETHCHMQCVVDAVGVH
jgi:hypothetical protein